jgi:hypothetical protein
MKLFGRTGGYYLFWTSAVYLLVGLPCALYYKEIPSQLFQIIWLTVLALPFTYPPLGRYFNLDVTWDRKMFDFFKKPSYNNVVPFPEPKAVPYIEPPAPKEKDPTIHYTIGHTDDNRVAFRLGYTTLMMNYAGVQALIDQLEMYQSQLHKETE